MLLKVTHETTLDYTDLITETVMELRMAPRQQDLQRRLSFSLAIGPSPRSRRSSRMTCRLCSRAPRTIWSTLVKSKWPCWASICSQ